MFMAPHYLNSQMKATLRLAWEAGREDSQSCSEKEVPCPHWLIRVLKQGPGRSPCGPQFRTNLSEFKFPRGEEDTITHNGVE